MNRCAWVPLADPLYVAYHDEEWGVPERDERKLFELLNLEGAQAGLSWSTILHKREGYRNAFAGWDIEAIARFDERDVERLVADLGSSATAARSRLSSATRRQCSRSTCRSRELLWSFVDGEPRVNEWKTVAEIPSETAESKAMSKELKRLGFRFTGPTTCYAFMQSAGLVDDHVVDCFRRQAP